jgi:hypothetical protein
MAVNEHNLRGNKLFQERACQALPLLVRQAKAEKPICYSDLAEELRMPNPRNLDYVLENGDTYHFLLLKGRLRCHP